MRVIFTAIAGLGLGVASLLAMQAGQATTTDQERILGAWRIAKAQGDGNEMATDLRELARLNFTKDGKAVLTVAGEGKDDGLYKFVAPGQMDFNLGDRQLKDLAPCIYKFEGDDRLILCFNDDPSNAKRPTEFTSEKGSGQVMFILERAKPGEEKPTAHEMDKHKDLVDKIREAPLRNQAFNNLNQIGRAIYFYFDVHKYLPLHAIYSTDGKTPLLSWRVAILPYLDQEALFKEFNLEESWDSPHNRPLIAKMPKAYEPIGLGKKDVGSTYYQVFTGPDTVFDGTKKLRFKDIHDGTSLTILVLEANEPVTWTKPADLELPSDKGKMPAIGGQFKDRTYALFCDAHIDHLSRSVPPTMLRALVTPNGGEKVDMDAWK